MHTHQAKETIIISVGGSLIVPDQIDTAFLSNLKKLLIEETDKGRHFIIIVGGGRTARNYQDAAAAISPLDDEDLDWLGIHSTRLNGHLVRTVLRDHAHPVMVTNPEDILQIPEDTPLVIAAGYRPGASTDLRSVQIAEHRGARRVINLSNIEYVYSDDPKTNPNAQKIEDITWDAFQKLIPSEWDPGLSSPFDPIAAQKAKELGLEVAVIHGKHLEELKKYLSDEAFIGTRICM